jgi:hypothetical protein
MKTLRLMKNLLICLSVALLLQSTAFSAVTYSATAKTNRMTAVRDTIDAGSAAGKLEICTASCAAVLATITLNDPSGTVSGSVLTLSGFPKTVAATGTGTAAEARYRDSDNNNVVTGLTVGTSGSDINLDSTSITSGQNVTINSLAITHN